MLEDVRAQIKTSLLSGDRFRVETLKLALAALMNARIAKRSDLDEAESIAIIQKEIKKRREAVAMYKAADAIDRSEKEEKEAVILEAFVPKMLSGEELQTAVDALLQTLGADLTFPIAMKACVEQLNNVDKAALAGILKTKLAK